MNRFFRSALFPLIVIVLLVYLASQTLLPGRNEQRKLTYSEAMSEVRAGNVDEATFVPTRQRIQLVLVGGEKTNVHYPTPQSATDFQNLLSEENVKFDSKGTGSSAWWALLINVLPFVILIAFWIFLMNQVQGGGSKVMSFGKSRAKRMSPDSPKVTFKDVAGADEAVEELHEIKEFLENPKKFQALGARIPKGVLLYGPPGTGKTLLARAVAGEAGVPFFSISGSDFVEMFVGVGASRVRDLFEQAKQASPCIIFMDEIDAVGRHRGAGLGGGHDEREQTLNQLLVEMDGFEMKDNIILIAATNRPDILDPALLRPGRFDRQIVVDRPDRLGRRKILEVHSRGKPLAREIDLDTLAAGTPGFTGADLSNLINEAALLAARRGKKMIEQDELEEGIMRVIAGPEKKARLLSEKERKITAYHEMGHALVGHYLEHTNPVHKITIVSRGQALGLTISLPTEDRYLTTKSALMDELAMTLGGRAAEELVFHEVTTGAANDLERVTATSKQMVMRFGMSEKLGPRVLGRSHEMPFLGRDMGSEPDYSEEIAKEIDDEIRRVIEEAHQSAHAVLRAHMDDLHRLSAILIERETIDKDQYERLLAGESEESVFPDEVPEVAPEDGRREEAEAQAAAAPDPRDGHAAPARRGRNRLDSSRGPLPAGARVDTGARGLARARDVCRRSPALRPGVRVRVLVERAAVAAVRRLGLGRQLRVAELPGLERELRLIVGAVAGRADERANLLDGVALHVDLGRGGRLDVLRMVRQDDERLGELEVLEAERRRPVPSQVAPERGADSGLQVDAAPRGVRQAFQRDLLVPAHRRVLAGERPPGLAGPAVDLHAVAGDRAGQLGEVLSLPRRRLRGVAVAQCQDDVRLGTLPALRREVAATRARRGRCALEPLRRRVSDVVVERRLARLSGDGAAVGSERRLEALRPRLVRLHPVELGRTLPGAPEEERDHTAHQREAADHGEEPARQGPPSPVRTRLGHA